MRGGCLKGVGEATTETVLQLLADHDITAFRNEDFRRLFRFRPMSAQARLNALVRKEPVVAALDKTKVKGTSTKRILTDLVSLVRYAMHQENELVPYPEKVMANFRAWLAQQQTASPPLQGEAKGGDGAKGRFTDEQRWWLEKMAEHIASNLGIEAEDFGYAPFNQRGGLGKVHQLFGEKLDTLLSSLNDALAA